MRPDVTQQRSDRLLTGPVGRTLLELAFPMILGLAAVILFNVVDTFYVGRLGAPELAAMGFTFPVVFLIMTFTLGLGNGVTSVISRALGEGDRTLTRRLATDGLILANALVVVVAAAGLFSIRPLFAFMGASPDIIDLIDDYMVPWYIGIGLLVIPMVGNAAIRATGDTKTPSFIMMIAGAVNVVLDPFLIFGIGPFPRLELQGAAIASVASWTVTFSAALWILSRREHLLIFTRPPLRAVWNSWRRILYVGIPSAATNVLIPITAAVITRMLAMQGAHAVAGYGVGVRIQSLSIIGVSALAVAAAPFTGQNFGARNIDRIRQGVRFSIRTCLFYGLAVAAVLAVAARPIAVMFNESEAVRHVVLLYLLLVPFTYGLYGIGLFVNSFFNAVNKPMISALLMMMRLLALEIPLAYAGAMLAGVPGVFVAIGVSYILVGTVSLIVLRRFLTGIEHEMRPPALHTAEDRTLPLE